MKKYYWQRKKPTKPPSKSRKKSKVVPKPENEYSPEETMLRTFDLDKTYGPCIGLTRLERWERAQDLGLKPPEQIKSLLENDKVQKECLWHKLSIRRETLSIERAPDGTFFIDRKFL